MLTEIQIHDTLTFPDFKSQDAKIFLQGCKYRSEGDSGVLNCEHSSEAETHGTYNALIGQ